MLVIRGRTGTSRIWVTQIGELDLAGAPRLDRELLVAQWRSGDVVLDLRALTFIDCAGLRPILAARQRARTRRQHFETLCGPGQVARILHLTGVDETLSVVEPRAQLPAGDTRSMAGRSSGPYGMETLGRTTGCAHPGARRSHRATTVSPVRQVP